MNKKLFGSLVATAVAGVLSTPAFAADKCWQNECGKHCKVAGKDNSCKNQCANDAHKDKAACEAHAGDWGAAAKKK